MPWAAGELCYCAGVEGDARPQALGESAADRDSVEWSRVISVERSRVISMAVTVTRCGSRSVSAGFFDPVDLAWIPLVESRYDWSPVNSAKSLDDNTTSAAPTASTSAPRDVAAASLPVTSSHASLASISVISIEDAAVPEEVISVEDAAVPSHEAHGGGDFPRQADAIEGGAHAAPSTKILASSKAGKHGGEIKMEALQALRDKVQAAISAHRAWVAARAPPLQTADKSPFDHSGSHAAAADEPAQHSLTEQRAPNATSDADVSVEPARVMHEPSIQATRPDEPNKMRMATATSPGRPILSKSLKHEPASEPLHKPMPVKALPVAMQVPCLFSPPVVPATLPHLFCGQADWCSGWAEAPVCTRVRGMEEDSSDGRAVRERRVLAPWLTPPDARHQCPALFLSHSV